MNVGSVPYVAINIVQYMPTYLEDSFLCYHSLKDF